MLTADEAYRLAKSFVGEKIEELKKLISSGFAPKETAVWYGVCNTIAGVKVKEVTIPGITEYTTGLNVRIKFMNQQSYNGTGPELDINSLGAKKIRSRHMTTAVQYDWGVGDVLDLVYDGSDFVISSHAHASTSYFGITKLSSSTSSTSEDMAATPKAVKDAYDLANGKPDLSSTATDIKMNGTQSAGSLTTAAKADHVHPSDTAKVDKETGKGLSANDFTNAYKNKLDDLVLFDVETPSFSSLPKVFRSTSFKSDCVVIGNAIELSNPDAGDIDWSVTFGGGGLMTISGTFHGSTATTAKMCVGRPTQTITPTIVI